MSPRSSDFAMSRDVRPGRHGPAPIDISVLYELGASATRPSA
ncbi:MAG: hypothetical protein SH850_08155 [Planctomycetaceae bacterium]|nr:hypothetical protein [Planctomycetaceae bacterium]